MRTVIIRSRAGVSVHRENEAEFAEMEPYRRNRYNKRTWKSLKNNSWLKTDEYIIVDQRYFPRKKG